MTKQSVDSVLVNAKQCTDNAGFFGSRNVRVALKRAFSWVRGPSGASCSLGARVLGDGLGSLADGVLGELAGQQETDGRLYLAAGDRRATVVVCETGCLGGDALEDVVDETGR